MVIQLLHKEKVSFEAQYIPDTDPDDDVLLYDLEQAASELKEEYTSFIEDNKISNYPTYEELINPQLLNR
jgi:hypothetical protein